MVIARTAYDEVAERYDKDYDKPMFLAEDAYIRKDILSFMDINGRSLDVGCGTGYLIRLLGKGYGENERYVGIDISGGMLTEAIYHHPNHHFIKASMEKIPYRANTFDNIFCLWSFAYSIQHKVAIAEMMRVLKPNGKIYLITYGYRHQSKQTYDLKDVNVPRRYYTPKHLKYLFASRGFMDVEVNGFRYLDIPDFYEYDGLPLKLFFKFDCFLAKRFPIKAYYSILKCRKAYSVSEMDMAVTNFGVMS